MNLHPEIAEAMSTMIAGVERGAELTSSPYDKAITVVIANKDIRSVSADGELIRELALDPSRDCQPLGSPEGGRDSSTMS